MTEDAKTFDLRGALEGRTYPEETVTIYLDEALAYAMRKMDLECQKHPADKQLENDRMALVAKLAPAGLKVHMRGVSRDIRDAMVEKLRQEFPSETDQFGKVTPHPGYAKEFDFRMWRLHITAIEDPSGAVRVPDEEDLRMLAAKAPDASIDAIDTGVAELVVGTSAGYEAAVSDMAFLSQASPKE